MDRKATDEQLVRWAQEAPEGDMQAFEALVERYQDRVLTNCRYMTRSRDDAEDLAQEVFVKAFFGLARFEGRSSFKTWIQRIKANHCLNFIKRRDNWTFVDPDDPALAGEPELRHEARADRGLTAEDERRRIAAVLDRMTDTLRMPLIMRDMDEMSYQEIAEALGIGLSAVKMRIKRAREEFRRLYAAGPAPPAGETA